jgi:squalene-hopene/tetraprenyl-beta-curcumene cyclase
MRTICAQSVLYLAIILGPPCDASAVDSPGEGWDAPAAGEYLDLRQKAWFESQVAERGAGENKSSCVCCHTLVPYAIARPALRKITGVAEPTEFEGKLLEQTKMRVANWTDLDTERFGLLYDFNDVKKKESLGTEAVLNALMLAFDDRYRGRPAPSEMTRKAFEHLWETQLLDGERKGSWEWLTFGLEPWESKKARYFGAALGAIAVGTAPGYFTPGADPELDRRVDLLRAYLKAGLPAESDYNRVWLLWASLGLDGLLDDQGRGQLIDRIVSRRSQDGGWGLSSLGTFTRSDGTPQVADSDGYATGLVLHVLQSAGLGKEDPRVALGIAWLKANQKPSGAWQGNSLNKQRQPQSSDPSTAFVGKFMWDAATAYAVLALGHE